MGGLSRSDGDSVVIKKIMLKTIVGLMKIDDTGRRVAADIKRYTGVYNTVDEALAEAA